MSADTKIRFALPSKGLEVATLNFLSECGLKVSRSNPRQYIARIKNMPNVEVVFQRAADIPLLVQSGDATFGITGYDILAEHRGFGDDKDDDETLNDDLMVLESELGYGACRLVVAVPETWLDVSNCADLWHLSGYYLEHRGRGIRIATKYPNLTSRFLRKHNISHYKLFSPHGALEAAPLTDTADLIVDLTETGTTLRENRLKMIDDGVVLRSQACLLANTSQLVDEPSVLRFAETLLELIEARSQAKDCSVLTAQVKATSAETLQHIARELQQYTKSPELEDAGELRERGAELRLSTSDTFLSESPNWYTISGVVRAESANLLDTVAFLRSLGAKNIGITPLTYRFAETSQGVRKLHARLKRVAR